MGVKISPAINPSYIPPEEEFFDKCEFKSEIFLIHPGMHNSDHDRYVELMNSMYPYDKNSKKMLAPNGGINKTFTKEGDMLIHVEYVEFIENKETKPEDRKY